MSQNPLRLQPVSWAAHEYGTPWPMPVTVRSAGAVPSTIAAIDARRNKGERSQQADVAFAMGFAIGNLGEGGDTAEPEVVDPSAGLGDGGEQSIAAFGLHRRLRVHGRMNDAFHGREAWSGPGQRERGRRRLGWEPARHHRVAPARSSSLDMRRTSKACGLTITRSTWRSIRSRSAAAAWNAPVDCKVPADAVQHEWLDLGRRHARDAAGLVLSVLQERVRDIIAVAHAELVRMRRAHAVAAVVEDAAGQNGGRAPEPDLPGDGVGGELGLHGLEQVAVEDRLMLAG